MITWQVALTLAIVLASTSTLLQRVFMRDRQNDPWAFAIFYQFLMGVIVGGGALLTGQLVFPNVSQIVPNLIFMTVVASLSYVFICLALAEIEASEFVVILSTRVIFTILASSVFISEGLVTKQWVGVGCILLSVLLVSMKHWKFKFGKGELLALLGAAAIGFANTNDRIVLKQMAIVPYLFLATMLPAIFLTIINPKAVAGIKPFLAKKKFWKLLAMAVIQVGVIGTFLLALQLGNNSSQVAAINNVNIVLTVLLAVVFLREKSDLTRKLAGAGLSFVGLILLS